jgi:hypothetical protein
MGIAPSQYPPPIDPAEEFTGPPTDPVDERIEVGVVIVGAGPARPGWPAPRGSCNCCKTSPSWPSASARCRSR